MQASLGESTSKTNFSRNGMTNAAPFVLDTMPVGAGTCLLSFM